MAVPTIFERLDRLRSRLRYVLWVHGLCWLITVFFLSALVAGFVDWLCQFNDTGVRLLLSLTILSSTVYAIWKHLWQPLSVRLTDVDLSVRIEQRHPVFEDSLSSTVQFLNSNHDQRVGSPELQREAVRRTLRQLEQVHVDRIVETQPVQRVAFGALIACLLAGIVTGFNQADAATAINRLAFPLANVPWPKQVDLQFISRDLTPFTDAAGPGLTAVRGDTLELFVENLRGAIPDDATLFVRRADGRVSREPMRITTLRDQHGTGHETGVANLTVTNGPLFIWARGGDSETHPVQVDVVPPPVISTFRLTAVPPEYTRQPTRRLSENVGDVRALVGTRLTLSARANKRLHSAQLHRKGSPPTALKIGRDGQTLSGEFTIREAGTWSWWLELRDRQGFGNPDAPRHEIRGIPDSAPVVQFVRPDSDLLVTPTAVVAFQVLAKDDLALKSVQLVYQATADSDSPLQPPPDAAPESTREPDRQDSSGEAPGNGLNQQNAFSLYDSDGHPNSLTLDYDWDLTSQSYLPGTRIVLTAQALDTYDLGDPHIGQSNPRTLTIVSPAEKLQELTERQALLILDLERAQALQTTARGHIEELQVQHRNSGMLRADDFDLLKRVELDQRQLESRMTGELDGLEARARSIQAERKSNHVEDAESSALLNTLSGELAYLRTDVLPQIRQQLTQTIKTAESQSPASTDSTSRTLDSAASGQDAVLRTLQDVLDQLSTWKNQRNLAGDLRDLTSLQKTLADETAETGQRIATKTASELTRQDEIDLARLAARQRQIIGHLEDFKEQLSESALELEQEAPEQAGTLQRAADRLNDSQVATRMQQAAAAMLQKRIAEASESQRQIVDELHKLNDVLEQRNHTDTESLIKQLTESGRELDHIRTGIEDVLQKVRDADEIQNTAEQQRTLETLRKRQTELQRTLDNTARRLQRLQSRAGSSAERAAQRLGQAEQATNAGDTDTAARELQEALDDTEQAQREVADDRRVAEEALARELMDNITDHLTALRDRQNALVLETRRLDSEYRKRGSWSRTLLKSLRNLSTVQKNLETETQSAVEQVQVVDILSLALRGAARSMGRAAENLAARNTDQQTVRWQTHAIQRFDDILRAFEKPRTPNTQPQPGQQQESLSSGPQGEQIAVLSQLRIVRALQADLNSRYDRIRLARDETGTLTEEHRTELMAIADEQAQLADLIRELTSAFGDPAPPEPDQAEPDQAEPDQAQPDQAQPDQAQPRKDSTQE